MFPFEEYVFNLGMLCYIRVEEPKNVAATRALIVLYSETVELKGEQAVRFIARAREAKWLDPPRSTLATKLVVPTAPLRTLKEQPRGG